jgi:predicted alpha/beta hydrolase family esterase
MSSRILFVQGGGAGTHDEWDNKLVESIERHLGLGVRYPRMPNEDDPSVAAWKPALILELDELGDRAIVVGHSVGGAILVEVLAEQRRTVAALCLISTPFIGEGGWPSDEIVARADLADRLPSKVFLYHGTADETVPVAHAQLYARALPQATVRVLPGRDHQLNNDLTEVADDIRLFEG